ncbi:regulatory subunit of 26S proteasome [Chloropicon primus]|uniref:Regulatory subunit of 26S proteasome n=1 Tax=Chloropicon primus TaxID=1764295 RepID=A0A5B8MKK5_9CHLO|nr:regulatory subunit of 26S proteasome [Chloropicon primus]UPR00129.1 regulatory subunit of 26S proteasome [Chloropicon primus]|eukprot:QDZ20919.1 regulatory subunit of 26S proteasome [Chloropicon primus]
MAPTTEDTMAEAQPQEPNVTKEKKKKAGMKKKESDIDYEALEKQIASIKTNAVGSSAEKLLSQTLEELLALEKTYRLQADLKATSMCGVAVVQACFEARQWKLLNEHVILISKRRAQLKQAVAATVKEAIGYIDSTPDEDTKIELIKTLTSVTEGKIYLELERARLTRKLAAILEARGKIDEAAEALQEVAVETFGAMAKTEKIAFILEQVRLCLKKKDFIRAFILVKKVTPRAFSEKRLVSDGKQDGEKKEMAMDGTTAAPPDEGIPSLEELKLVYYEHLIAYYTHTNDALEICRCYQNIYDTPSIKGDTSKWTEVLKKVCWYVVLAPSGPMQSSILHMVHGDENLAKLPLYERLLRIFVKNDIVQWTDVQDQFGVEMMEQDSIFLGKVAENRDTFKLRVVDHNILVISNYYSQITLPRLADILKIDVEEAEKYLSDLVLKKTVKAKINRPQGIINFGAKPKPEEVLSQWSGNIGKLLELLEKSCHKIHKEAQQHKVLVPSMRQ